VEVRDAIVSIGRISSSFRLILNAVGTVDQNRIARPAYMYDCLFRSISELNIEISE
jgi:hypothetical protein